MFSVIFLCVCNAGRSQVAAAFFNQLADPAKARTISAGTEPSGSIHPEVLSVMKGVGVQLSNAKPQKFTKTLAKNAKFLITMGCGEECLYFPGLRRNDWLLSAFKGRSMEEVRAIRDELRNYIRKFLLHEDLGKFRGMRSSWFRVRIRPAVRRNCWASVSAATSTYARSCSMAHVLPRRA